MKTKKPVNPIHGKPLWGLVRLANDPDIDQEILDAAPHLAFMFSDVELIAMRVVLSAVISTSTNEDPRFQRILDAAETGLEKLRAILNAELEDEPTAPS